MVLHQDGTDAADERAQQHARPAKMNAPYQ
jgi:hypothetical protein